MTAPDPFVDPKSITPENLEEVVAQVTDDLLAAEKHAEAIRRVRDNLARRVLNEAGAAVPTMMGKLRPRFDAAVGKFRDAVGRLPKSLDADSLVKAGPDALVALAQAREAAAEIKPIDSWLARLVNIPAYGGHDHDPILRLFAPETTAQLSVLTNAKRGPKDPVVVELGEVLLAGIRAGVPTAMNTPHDIARIRAEIG